MCGEFGEVTVIIGLIINFLAFVSPLLSFRDTLSYIFDFLNFHCLRHSALVTLKANIFLFLGNHISLKRGRSMSEEFQK